jgi:iron complex transport system substrate-binding protein
MQSRALITVALTALMFAASAQAAVRVVSLNPCLDTVLVHIAEREQIAGISHYSRLPGGSTITEIAQTLPYTYESAEEVIALKPDLVLTSGHSSLATRNALKTLGIETKLFPVPEKIDQSIAQIREIAALIGREEKAEEVIARIHVALEAARAPADAPKVRAVVLQRNGIVPGAGTLAAELMNHTGFENVAGQNLGIGKWGSVELERLINHPPQVLLAEDITTGKRTWADLVLLHPALQKVSGQMMRAVFPDKYLYCGGPVLIESSAALAAARTKYLAAHP